MIGRKSLAPIVEEQALFSQPPRAKHVADHRMQQMIVDGKICIQQLGVGSLHSPLFNWFGRQGPHDASPLVGLISISIICNCEEKYFPRKKPRELSLSGLM